MGLHEALRRIEKYDFIKRTKRHFIGGIRTKLTRVSRLAYRRNMTFQKGIK